MHTCSNTIFKSFLSILFALFLNTTIAQTIKGKVADANTGEPLAGATVKLDGTKYVALVKLDGTFIFTKIPDGNYKVTVTYLGYKNVSGEPNIVVNTDNTKVISFLLMPLTTELQSVTISAVSGSDKGARRLEKIADPVLNILSAKTIQLLPDITVANALQRVSGVTIEKSSSGEGRYPIIRGMEKRYINTLVNGIKIPSPDNKNRFIPLDLFPSELLERLEVSKSLTPSMEGDAIGGTINLVMKDAPVNKLLLANFGNGYNNIFGKQVFSKFDNGNINKKSPEQINGNTYNAVPADFSVTHLNYTAKAHPINTTIGLSYGNRFGESKKLGMLLSASYQNLFRGTSSTFFLPNAQPGLNNIPQFVELQSRTYSLQSQRLGLNSKFDYNINRRNKISWFNTYVMLADFQTRQISDTIALNSLVDELFRSTWQYQSIYNSTLQGNHHLSSSVKFDWSAVYSIAKNNMPDQAQFTHEFPIVTNASTGAVTRSTPDIISGITHVWQHNSDKDYAAYVNFTKQFKISNRNSDIKIGGLVRDKARDNFYNSYSLNPQLSSGSSVQNYTNINNATFIFKGAGSGIPSLNGNNYTFKENILAGYIQVKLQLTARLELLGGVRVEDTHQKYNTELGKEIDARSGKISYTDVLPSVQFKYALNNKQSIRAAYYKALARPGFAELIPDGPDGEFFKERGNPIGLNHTTSDNFDLRYELFPQNADQILIGVFYKNIGNPIEYTAVKTGVTSQTLIPTNLGTATNYGFEAVFTKYFGVFGISANYTYTQSKITNDSMLYSYRTDAGVRTTKYISETRPLQGQSNHIGNFSLIYKNPKIGFDAQAAFVYTGERISLVSPYAGLHYWQQPISQLDVSFEKRIVKKFSFYGKINNLTNSPLILSLHQSYNTYAASSGSRPLTLQTDPDNKIIVQKDYYKTSFLFGLRYKF